MIYFETTNLVFIPNLNAFVYIFLFYCKCSNCTQAQHTLQSIVLYKKIVKALREIVSTKYGTFSILLFFIVCLSIILENWFAFGEIMGWTVDWTGLDMSMIH